MREIKFRAWDKTEKRMKYVIGLNWDMDTPSILKEIYTYPIAIYGVKQAFCRILNEVILMQYTGLKDKNGKEIYEGDILASRVTGSISLERKDCAKYQVVFKGCGFICEPNDIDLDIIQRDGEVIGNSQVV